MVDKIGFVLFIIGAGAMSSESKVIPAIMTIVGLAIILIESRREEA